MAARHRGMMKTKEKAPPVRTPGMAVMEEAASGAHGFKKGGKIKEKVKMVEQVVEGSKPKHRMDRMPRKASGGAVSMRGRSPYSAASNMKEPSDVKEDG